MRSAKPTSPIAEHYWGTYYWVVMGVVLALAFFLQYPWNHRGDLATDALFLVWTGLGLLAARSSPFYARLIHALGVLPVLAFYAAQPDTQIPYALHPQLYLLLAFFPVYTATAMIGPLGFAVSVALAWALGLSIWREPGLLPVAVLYWALAGLLGLGYYWMARRLAAYHRTLLERALSDPLTGLGNRRALEEDYPRYQALAAREGERLILTLWDVNDLKAINDRYGHAAGDRVLRKFARVLQGHVRKSDPLYRIGGDEFAGLHLGLNDPDRLLERVRADFPWASAGWIDASALPFDEAYRRVDRNLYRDKANKPEELARLTREEPSA